MNDAKRPLSYRAALVLGVGGVTLTGVMGCQHRVTVDPIKVEPIHLTLDVKVTVDRELDDFFDFEDQGDAAPDELPAEVTEQGAPS